MTQEAKEFCPHCGAEISSYKWSYNHAGQTLSEMLGGPGGMTVVAEQRVRDALHYMETADHQPPKSSWSRIHWENLRNLLRGGAS